MKKMFVSMFVAAALTANATTAFAAEASVAPAPVESPYVIFHEDIADGLRSLTVSDITKDYLVSIYQNGTAAPAPLSGLTTQSAKMDIWTAAADIRDEMANVLGNYHRTLPMTDVEVFYGSDDSYSRIMEGEFDYEVEPEDEHGHNLITGYTMLWSTVGAKPNAAEPIAVVYMCPEQRWFANYVDAVKMIRDIVHTEMNITESDTKEEALAKINNWFCENWTYDEAAIHDDILTAVANRRGLCNQITRVFEIAADYCDIDCSLVASLSMHHDWVSVNLNGETYYYDPTYALDAYQQTGDPAYKTEWNHVTRTQMSKDHTF